MKISELAVKNHQFTIVVFLMLIALGIYSFIKIPQAEDPEFPLAIFPVIALYPGASPSDIEELVLDRIEESINELENIYRVTSDIKEGIAILVVEYESDTDPDEAYNELLSQVNSIKPLLPGDLYSLDVIKIQAGNTNIIQSALVSETAGYAELGRLAEELRDQISSLPGIRKADATAFPAQEIRVEADLPKMARLRISISQVISAIQSENANIPGGSIDIGTKRFNVTTSGSYKNIEELKRTVVGNNNGQLVYLKDVADVRWDYEELRYYGRDNGKRAALVIASMKTGENIHEIRNSIYSLFDAFDKRLPAGITLERGFDQSENVKYKLGRLERDFIFAFLLVLVTLMPLGFRASGIVMISIPLSVMIGFTGLYLTGFSINQLSIVGAVVALGLLVDDSIVVVENISRWVRGGTKPKEAAIAATSQIGLAVIGCTATLLFAFLPLMFLPGKAGMYMRVFPTAVGFIVLGSLFVALTIIPFISSLAFRENTDPRGNVVLRGFHKVIDFTYGRALRWSLSNPVKTVLAAAIFFLASLWLVRLIGFSLFPKAGVPQFLITIETPRGSSIAETDRAVQFAESVIERRPEIKYYMSNIGKGNPMVYYNSFQKQEQATTGEIMCEVTRDIVPELDKFLDELRDTLDTYVNARFYVNEFENGSPVDAPIAMRIVGNDLDTLKRYSLLIEDIFRSHQAAVYVRNPLNQALTGIKIDINTEKAAVLGIPSAEIDRTIRLGLEGIVAGKFRDSRGKEYSINVRMKGGDDGSAGIFDNLYVSSLSGYLVPLSQVASIRFSDSPTYIEHYNNERSMTVSSSVMTGFNTDAVTKEILRELGKLNLPEGFRIVEAGEIESRKESFEGIGTAIIIALFGIFAVLILEFRTFRSTLIVLSVIPLGFIGGLLMLWATGYTLSFAAAVGFVALIGIEIKNSILLVDFTNQLRKQGTPLDEAIEKAGEIRFLPVLLTTLTAIGGLLPIALSKSALYSPLACVIIGGLITSTLLARLVTPVMYKIIPPKMN